ncbi:MAG: LysM peptidoglycan-binding domain-containing protein [Planctomycetes bacterium]|nr:LysM peptidoglycan-binding domain-containing protein [Planctomycetota bacterium]
MKIILNSLLFAFLAYFFSPLFNSGIASGKDKDIIIYKKDIIIRSDELKAGSKKDKDAEEFKPIEKTAEKKQEAPSLDIVDKYLKEGKKYEARNILSDLFINKKIPEKQKEIKELLDKLNEELIFSSSPFPDATMYTVQAGDIMARIAKQFNTNYELIIRINNKSPTRLNIGDKLKILTGKTKLLISKSDFTLTLLLNDHYVKQYRIGTGKNDKTPVGTFEVKNKMKDPTWYSPNGGIFPYGHPENILGTRWIGFKDKPDLYGYGIHGTTLPDSIGTASSNGCVRMLNSDVEELYDFVTLDTEIIIQR